MTQKTIKSILNARHLTEFAVFKCEDTEIEYKCIYENDIFTVKVIRMDGNFRTAGLTKTFKAGKSAQNLFYKLGEKLTKSGFKEEFEDGGIVKAKYWY